MVTSPEITLSLAGLEAGAGSAWSGGVREAVAWAAGLGYRRVQLDARVLRARELSRSARRDVGAMLRRHGLVCTGMDAWIPTAHIASGAHTERAVAAVAGACELAGELAGLTGGPRGVVCVVLPEDVSPAVEGTLVDAAERAGVVLADHAWPVRKGSRLAVGVDPAEMLRGGVDPSAALAGLTPAPSTARLTDWSEAGRVTVGHGRLRVAEYVAVLMTVGMTGPLVVDVRGVRDQADAAAVALRRFAG
ncbi:MAG: hypothetical protein HBSAPP03_16660 [Phycisphaerae bacterium]|nr:MAG: hypothetical protein HBSAPP03_16660 [Phycisphaerae bacterium]